MALGSSCVGSLGASLTNTSIDVDDEAEDVDEEDVDEEEGANAVVVVGVDVVDSLDGVVVVVDSVDVVVVVVGSVDDVVAVVVVTDGSWAAAASEPHQRSPTSMQTATAAAANPNTGE